MQQRLSNTMEVLHSMETLPEERTPQATSKKSRNDTVLKLARCLICNGVSHDVNVLFKHYKTKHHWPNECTCATYSDPNYNGTSHNMLSKVEVRSKDETIVLYRCQSCKQVFTTCCKCLEHCKSSHLQRPFECGSCQETFAEFKELHLHLRKHDCRAKVACGYCKKVFTNVQTLNLHVNKHKKEQGVVVSYKAQNENNDALRNNRVEIEESSDNVEDQRNTNGVGEESKSLSDKAKNENDDALRNNRLELEKSSDNIEDQRNNNGVGEESKSANVSDKVLNENDDVLRNKELQESHDNIDQAKVAEDGQSFEGHGKNSSAKDKQAVVKKRRGRPPKNTTASNKSKAGPSNASKKTTEESKKRGCRPPSNRVRPPYLQKQSKPIERRPQQQDKQSEPQILQSGGYFCVICTKDFRLQSAYDKHMVVYHHIRRNKRNCAMVVRDAPDLRQESGTEEDHDSDEDDQNPRSPSSDSLRSLSSSDSEWNSNVDPFTTSKSPMGPAPSRVNAVDEHATSKSPKRPTSPRENAVDEHATSKSPKRPTSPQENAEDEHATSKSPKKSDTEEAATEAMVQEQSPVANTSPSTPVREKKGGKTSRRKRKKGRLNSPSKKAKKMRIVSDEEDDDDGDTGLSTSKERNQSVSSSDHSFSLPGRVAWDFPPSSCEERSNSDERNAVAPETPVSKAAQSSSDEHNAVAPEIPVPKAARSNSDEPIAVVSEIPVLALPQDLIEISDDEGADYGEPAMLSPQGKSAIASTYPKNDATPQRRHSQHNNDHYASTSFTHSSPDAAVLVGNQVTSPKILISNVCSIPHCDKPANNSDPRFAQRSSNPMNISNPAPSSFHSANQKQVDSHTYSSSATSSIPMQRVVPPAFSTPPSSIPVQTVVSPTISGLSASSTILAQRVTSPSYSSTSSVPIQRVVSPVYSATSSIPPPMQVDHSHGTPMCVRCWRDASTTNVCKFCGIIFTDVDIYTLHKLIHDRENPYKCTGCGKVFGSKYQFTSHIFRDPHP